MTTLTAEQREEVSQLIELSNLSKDQRTEVDSLIDSKLKSTGLSFAQKWEAGVIVATLLGGALAIFGAAGFFLIKSTAEQAAKSTIVDTRQEQVASLLSADDAFIKKIAGSITTLPDGGVVAFDLSSGCP